MKLTVEQIAQITHATNRAYCTQIGDPSQPIWECTPKWQRDSAVAGVKNIIANPEITPKQSHEAWADHKIKAGWKHGPKKDERKKEHPCLVGYDRLPVEQQAKDALFISVVKSLL